MRPLKDPSILFDGDSITLGTGAVPGTSDWPSQCIEGVGGPTALSQPITRLVMWRNMALGGAPSTQCPNGLRSAFLYICLIGTNDLISSAITGAALYTSIAAAHQRALGYGCFATIAGTILPSSSITAGKETARLACNALIRSAGQSAPFTTYIDFAAIQLMQNPADLTYYADGIHPTALGYQQMAELAQVTINATIGNMLT